jgi:hypothetical protein
MTGDNQHYLPATVIAGFGQRPAGARRRDSEILVRDLPSGNIRSSTAREEARRHALYRLDAPPPGIDPDWVDERWTRIENALPELIDRLVRRALVPGDEELLVLYAAMLGSRHPSFSTVAADYQAKQGHPAPSGDLVNLMRIEAIFNGMRDMPSWRWRVLHPTEDSLPFMLPDRGWIYVGRDDGTRALWIPMAPTAGILGYPDDDRHGPRQPPFSEHRDLIPSWITWLNAAAANDAGRVFTHAIFTHPDNANALAALSQYADLGPEGLGVNALGPFRGRGFGATTLFD